VWGGNYFDLPTSRAWIFWDKLKYVPNYADGELAWTSFDRNTKKIQIQHHGFLTSDGRSIHPTQKPVALYDWIFKNYAEQGFKILDTHGGSMSSVISADKAGLEMVCCELDKEYFDKAVDRFQKYKSQYKLAI
jgi:site-specific DNA-methyltransferase (adenine-specific)